jgi:hypothetical protein
MACADFRAGRWSRGRRIDRSSARLYAFGEARDRAYDRNFAACFLRWRRLRLLREGRRRTAEACSQQNDAHQAAGSASHRFHSIATNDTAALISSMLVSGKNTRRPGRSITKSPGRRNRGTRRSQGQQIPAMTQTRPIVRRARFIVSQQSCASSGACASPLAGAARTEVSDARLRRPRSSKKQPGLSVAPAGVTACVTGTRSGSQNSHHSCMRAEAPR